MAFYLGARITSDIKRCQEERPRGHPADSRSGHLPIGRCDSPELTHSATAEVGDAKKSLSLSPETRHSGINCRDDKEIPLEPSITAIPRTLSAHLTLSLLSTTVLPELAQPNEPPLGSHGKLGLCNQGFLKFQTARLTNPPTLPRPPPPNMAYVAPALSLGQAASPRAVLGAPLRVRGAASLTSASSTTSWTD